MPDRKLVARFHRGLSAMAEASRRPFPFDGEEPLGIAVSGGPDSLALLLLAAGRFPGRVRAATFDHGFRPESVAEADHVHSICATLSVPHETLGPGCTLGADDIAEERRRGGLQALARAWRYRALERWCRRVGAGWLLTAHHADDQAETVLMRLARGAGVRGLSGIRPALTATMAYAEGRPGHEMTIGDTIVGRPLLGFSKAELAAIVASAGLEAVDDPSNADPRFDRTLFRRLLAEHPAIDAKAVARVGAIMRDTDAALAWAAAAAWTTNATETDDGWSIDPAGLPTAVLRRLVDDAIYLVEGVASGGAREPWHRGAELTRLIERLHAGDAGTLCDVQAIPGPVWRFRPAPPRRGS